MAPYGTKGYKNSMPKSKTHGKKHRLTPKNPQMKAVTRGGEADFGALKKMYKTK